MAQLDRAKLDAANIAFSTIFDRQLTRTPTIYQELATVMQTNRTEQNFRWFGDVPKMTLWMGQRTVHKLRAEGHRIVTRDWANGIEVHKDEIADDQLGLIQPRIADLADQGQWAIEDLVMDMYNNSIQTTTQGTTYDNQALIDTDHTAQSNGAGTAQSNLITGALSPTTYAAGWERMMSLLDASDQSIRLQPDTLLVGVANRAAARTILLQERKANGEDNLEAGTARLIVHPRITGTKWFLINTRMAIRPVVVLIRQAPMFAAVSSMNDDYYAFMNGTFMYGADARFGAGFGMWQGIVGGTGVP